MLSKLVLVVSGIAYLMLGTVAANAFETAGPPAVATEQVQHTQETVQAEMTAHQTEMKALTVKLTESFRAISEKRDPKGYVQDKSLVKAHEANIKELRTAVREHKLFLGDYEHVCGVNGKQQDAMIQHQQQMKGVLYDVVDSFDAFENANDQVNNPNIDITMSIGEAFVAHREALKEFSDDISQHQRAMADLVAKCQTP